MLKYIGIVIAVAVGIILSQGLFRSHAPTSPPATTPKPPIVPAPSPEEITAPHLTKADQNCKAALEKSLASIDEFFNSSKQNTKAFADEALGWSSKWALAVDYIPYTDGDRHKKFIRAKFAEHIFREADLQEVITQAITSYLTEIESIESQMLVELREDVANLPKSSRITELNDGKLKASYREAIQAVIQASSNDLAATLGTTLASEIVGTVVTAVALRLGVSAGILSASAGSAATTLGISVVVGLIVDQIVTWVWDWYANPVGELTDKLNNCLDEMRRAIIDGTPGSSGGLRQQLQELTRERATIRKQALLSLF